MKKSNFFKTVLGVAAAMLISTGVYAQYPASPYTLYDANKTAPTNTDYVTAGKTLGYYALPDPVYHPSYATAGTLTLGFTWTWASSPATTTITPGSTAALANYVTILYPTPGSYTVTVRENSPAAFGGCSGPLTTMMVEAIASPLAAITTADTTAEACGNLPATKLGLSFTEDVPVAFASYAFAIVETVENLDILGVATPVTSNPIFVSYQTNSKLKAFTTAASPYLFDFNTSARVVVGGKRTRYTYTLVKAADLPALTPQGVVSAISQKSDYLNSPASITTYAFGKSTISYVVNPAPATGPIYYIPNNFAY
jgi:hypothetical protein